MIFSGNTTALGATTIPMAEGYDCSYGASLALVEAARNDLAMFQALVQADYKEMAICKESTGVVQEGEIASLHEAVGGGIFKKIAELFKKLVAKIKGIFHNFMAKINGLTMKDKDLVKKYQGELARKRNLDKLEVKWRKVNESAEWEAFDVAKAFKKAEGWAEDSWDRVKFYLGKDVDSVSEFVKEAINESLEEEDTVTLGSIDGGWRALVNFINGYASKSKTMQKNINTTTTALEKLVKEYDKAAGSAADASVKDKDNEEKANAVGIANKEYDMAQAYQTAMLAMMQVCTQVSTIEYKQAKAAFMKAVAVSDKKLEESAVYAQAIAEAAEQEVDDVINSALTDEEISDLSAATVDVKDADVSDCPDKLTYGPDCYTDNASMDGAEGSVDTTVGDGKVEESAFFGEMLY